MFESFGVLNAGLYALGALALILVPGPNTIFIFKTSVQLGTKSAFRAASAVWAGDAVLMFLAYLGVAAALQANPVLFQTVRILGAAYLAYFGISTIIAACRRKSQQEADGRIPAASASPFRTALILSLTNPRAIIFYVAFFTQYINPAYEHAWVPYTILAGILESFSIAWASVLCFAGAAVMRFAGRNPLLARLGNTAVGTLFIGFAGQLMLV